EEMRAMDAEETARFIEASLDSIWGLVFRFALETGMRPEEYLGLQWRDVDLARGSATVRRTLCWRRSGRTEEGFCWYWGEGKTAGSRRTLPLSAPIVEELKRHKEFQGVNAVHYDPKYKDLDLVFRMPKGAPINSDVLGSKYFKPVLERAQLPSTIRLYDLRHTMATLLLLAGEHPKILSERLGHTSIQM